MGEKRLELKIGSPVIAIDGNCGHIQHLIIDPHQEKVIGLIVKNDPLILEKLIFQEKQIPKAIDIRTGLNVLCEDGLVGRVNFILLDPTGKIKRLIVRADGKPHRDFLVPVERIQVVDKEAVSLSLDQEAFEHLDEYVPDEELEDNIHHTIWNNNALWMTYYSEFNATVKDGIITLRGYVPTASDKRIIENTVKSVAGVLGIEDLLAADYDLSIAVARALSRDEDTRLAMISVNTRKGIVSLSGHVECAASRYKAEGLAASIPDVRGVINTIQSPGISIDPGEDRFFQPPINREVYATDMFLGSVEKVMINPQNRRVMAILVHGNFELCKLQDAAPPELWEDIRTVLIEELEDQPENIFAQVDPVPLAAASLAQVHPAILKNGDFAVVKVQRPNIRTMIETDLAILRELAILAQHTEWGERNQPEEIAEEFSLSLRDELDYDREGRNAVRFQSNFAGDEKLHVPTVYWKYSTRRVLVMERLEGIKVNDIAALDAAGYNRKQLALDAASCIVKEVLQYGFYHADPHGGNLIVLQGGVIGVIDFGMMGELRENDRQSLARLYISAASLDIDGIVDELMRLSVTSSNVNVPRLMRDLDRLFRKYCGLTLQQMRFQEMMQDFTTMMQRHRLVLPSHLWMLAKTIVMMEGLGLKLDPDFDIFAVSEPIVERLKWQMLWPNAEWGKALLRRTTDWSELARLFPRASRRLLEKIEQNQCFDVALSNADLLLSGFGRLVNRLSLSMIIASMVIGLAVLISTTSNGSPIQILIMAGFMGTVVMGIWLMISIFRGR